MSERAITIPITAYRERFRFRTTDSSEYLTKARKLRTLSSYLLESSLAI